MSASKPVSLLTVVQPQPRFVLPVIDPQAGSGLKNVAINIAALTAEIDAQVAVETSRAEAAEAALGASIVSETSRAEGAETALTSSIASETTRAEAAEGTISASVTTERTRAQAAEGVLSTAIAAETTRAQGAEAALMPNTQAAFVAILNSLPTSIVGRSVGDWVVLNGVLQKLQP